MGNRWEPGVVVDHTTEYCRNRKMLMKLPVCGAVSTDDSHFHEPPSGSVNGSPSCREKVSQANPAVEEPVSASPEQEKSLGDGSLETSEQYKSRSGRVMRTPLRFKDYV